MSNKEEKTKITIDVNDFWFDAKEHLEVRRYSDVLANNLLPEWLQDPELSKEYKEILEKRKKIT